MVEVKMRVDDDVDPRRVAADRFEPCAPGQRTPEISHADSGDPLVGFNLQSDDRARCVRVFRGVGKRLVGW